MTLEQLAESLPAYAKDMKLNLSSVLRQPELTPNQTWGTALACAVALRNPQLLEAVTAEAAANVAPNVLEAARTAAAIMAMNNVYYRFQHLSGNEKYTTIPTRLRMNGIRTHGGDPVDFELWCTAVSAVNGCGKCVVAHERVLRDKSVTEETIAASVRIASVLHAVAVVLDAAHVAAPAAEPAAAV